ncbi:MAG TPA: N-acetylmuramidase domain-containing protein [Stellaceae bacterium]|nr:N-acetylmuramidase domain-containing protein [Stellaceae bacterium]
MVEFAGAGTALSLDGLTTASGNARIGLPELWSVLSVETAGCGFLPDRRPKILFERHIFHRLTDGQFDAEDPDVSQPTAGGYGPGGAHQYERLAAALLLDRGAALKSASWGMSQIMGTNFEAAGFGQVEDLVATMVESEDKQLLAGVQFIIRNGMDVPLRNHDWSGFARRYNGPNFAANNYDGLLEHFFHRYAAGPTPDVQIRAAQIYLIYKGFKPGAVDGVKGPATTSAVKQFQQSISQPDTGTIDDALIARLIA